MFDKKEIKQEGKENKREKNIYFVFSFMLFDIIEIDKIKKLLSGF